MLTDVCLKFVKKGWYALLKKFFQVCLIICFRHTEEMIQKLESAGLGYHVSADETEDKLGISWLQPSLA